MQKYNSRKDVPEEYKWNLTDFFKNDDEFNKSLEETKNKIEALVNYNDCIKDAHEVYEFLKKSVEALALWEDLYVYSYLVNDQELGNSESQDRLNKALLLNSLYEKNTSFFAPELLKLSKEEYDKLFCDEPKLLEFKADLDRTYRQKEHVLTENEEKIIAELTGSMNKYEQISSTLLNSLNDYGKIKLDDGTVETIATNNLRRLLKNKNREIRKKVYNSFYKKIDQYEDTSASLLGSYIAMNDSVAKIRHYKDSWDEKLNSLNLDDKVYKTLVKTTEDNLDALQKYYSLKKDILGLDVLHSYDLNLDITQSNREYSISEAQDIVRQALKPLGEEYGAKYEKIIKNRYIDYCQYKGKCSGGYSFATINKPSRILMSFNGDLDGISTIAHESGHNVHHQFISENNPMQYHEQSSLVSEVCSLTNECLLSHYVVKNAKTKEEKLQGLYNIMGVIVSNLFGSVREGKMEQDMYEYVHAGNSLTKDYMDALTEKSLKKYYGNSVKTDKYSKCSWVLRSHYYMHFYLYSYAICISVATNVASNILAGSKDALDKYIEFMKCGGDKWPAEAFAILGISLDDENVYKKAIEYFEELVDEYRKIYFDKEV